MTKYIVEESGDFRSGEEGVFNGEECIFMAPPARFVPQLMNELFGWMKKEKDQMHPLILSSVFHYEFVFIHPFTDGNGRMARLWHTAILAKWNPIFEYIPIESQIEKFQDDYYDAIAKCHVEGESTEFIEFKLTQIDNTLAELLNQMTDSATDAAILAKMGERGQLGNIDIDGPLALDVAIDKEAAEIKKIKSPVAGDADCLVFPNIESGNVFYKTNTKLANARQGAILVGATAPSVLSSRGDSVDAKLNSIALAALFAK